MMRQSAQMINPGAMKERRRAFWYLAVAALFSPIVLFLWTYFDVLSVAYFRHTSYGWVEWPLPAFVTLPFMRFFALSVLFLMLVLAFLWIVAIKKFQTCPTLADVYQNHG